MQVILFDDKRWQQLLPLTFTKPTAALRIGIGTIREKWETQMPADYAWLAEPYLQQKFPVNYGSDNLYIYGGVIPNNKLIAALQALKNNEALISDNEVIAIRSTEQYFSVMSLVNHAKGLTLTNYTDKLICITRTWHLFQFNDEVLRSDYAIVTANRKSQEISNTNTIIGKDIFVEPGAKIEACIINTQAGPVYIGSDAEIMEGSMIRGPFALGKHATVKMGSKIYGATSIGPYCKVGGEINNSIFIGYSSKAHDGFVGNSVIGEWCNMGADSNNSNLKNNYAEVKLWDYPAQKFVNTGLQFCGLIMGDHSKCGINTMFNTGTVVGVNANIFGDGFLRNFIPSFSWGGAAGFVTYKLSDALGVASEVMKRRNLELLDVDIKILTTVYELSEKYRKGQLIFLHK